MSAVLFRFSIDCDWKKPKLTCGSMAITVPSVGLRSWRVQGNGAGKGSLEEDFRSRWGRETANDSFSISEAPRAKKRHTSPYIIRMTETFRDVDLFRVRDHATNPETDRVAVEEPLEVRLEGEPFSVIMRTPGADDDLAAGFLFHEGVIRNADDVRLIEVAELEHD